MTRHDEAASALRMTAGDPMNGGNASGALPSRVEPAGRRDVTADMLPAVRPMELRSQFPLLQTCVYLNSNVTGPTPRSTKDVLDDYWRTLERWRDEAWSERWFGEVHAHADELASLIGAPAGSVICDGNIATLLSRVLSCFDYRARPAVVTSDLEYPTVTNVIRAFERDGAVAVIVPSRDGVAIDAERIVRSIDERTQLVIVSHATFEAGALLDVTPIVRRAHEVGALVVLDAYESAGVVPIDVERLDVDFLIGGAHKWLLGSYEAAFLYVRPELLSRLRPAGWLTSAPLPLAAPAGWADGIGRFAGPTPAVLPALVSRPGLAMIRELGVDSIRCLSLTQTDHVISRADEAKLAVLTPRPYSRRAGIVALRFPGDETVARALVASGFVCSYRGALRIAPHFFTAEDEIDRFMDELVRRAREVTGS